MTLDLSQLSGSGLLTCPCNNPSVVLFPARGPQIENFFSVPLGARLCASELKPLSSWGCDLRFLSTFKFYEDDQKSG